MAANSTIPSQQLFLAARAGFVSQGQTLHGWCRKQGITPTVARQALLGSWNGPKGKAMRARILKAAGVSP